MERYLFVIDYQNDFVDGALGFPERRSWMRASQQRSAPTARAGYFSPEIPILRTT